MARLRHSRMGRAFEAVKLDETAAEAMGVNVTRAKLIAFATGAFVAGVGGGLYAHHAVFIQYDNFEGRWGEQAALDKYLQAYAVEATKLAARRKGLQVSEQTLQDGSIKLYILEGGG